jgi:NAD(P)-dependent dehydrogenase (short-subunit alcohol dehydrogenase family)
MSDMATGMRGKVCAVTGANSGIGRATAEELARMGATVILVCRDRARGEEARDAIASETGNAAAELIVADLASLGSTRRLAEAIKGRGRLDVLVNNAGVIIGKRTVTPDGLEATFVINYLSHFLLTNLLLETLKASAPSRVVNVTSDAHYRGHIDFGNLQRERRYISIGAYSQSKLAQVLFTHELARRLEGSGVAANCVHPGGVRTHWGDEGGLFGIGVRIARPFLLSPEKGAETVVYAASAKEMEGVTGKYLTRKRVEEPSKESSDEGISKRLWDVSLELSGLATS